MFNTMGNGMMMQQQPQGGFMSQQPAQNSFNTMPGQNSFNMAGEHQSCALVAAGLCLLRLRKAASLYNCLSQQAVPMDSPPNAYPRNRSSTLTCHAVFQSV